MEIVKPESSLAELSTMSACEEAWNRMNPHQFNTITIWIAICVVENVAVLHEGRDDSELSANDSVTYSKHGKDVGMLEMLPYERFVIESLICKSLVIISRK
jgi:hypothetical protein